jgi:hypothetical protein
MVSIRQISGSYLDNQIDAKRIPEFAGISERIVPAIAKLADSGEPNQRCIDSAVIS